MTHTPAQSTQISDALSRGDAKAAMRLLRDAGATHGNRSQAHAQAAGEDGFVMGQGMRDALASGNPIEAIRRFRAANPGLGLRDAKAALQQLQAQAGVAAGNAGAKSLVLRARAERTPTVQDGDHGGYAIVLLAVLAAAGALAWWWLGGG